jgi:hypothetical protein
MAMATLLLPCSDWLSKVRSDTKGAVPEAVTRYGGQAYGRDWADEVMSAEMLERSLGERLIGPIINYQIWHEKPSLGWVAEQGLTRRPLNAARSKFHEIFDACVERVDLVGRYLRA